MLLLFVVVVVVVVVSCKETEEVINLFVDMEVQQKETYVVRFL